MEEDEDHTLFVCKIVKSEPELHSDACKVLLQLAEKNSKEIRDQNISVNFLDIIEDNNWETASVPNVISQLLFLLCKNDPFHRNVLLKHQPLYLDMAVKALEQTWRDWTESMPMYCFPLGAERLFRTFPKE